MQCIVYNSTHTSLALNFEQLNNNWFFRGTLHSWYIIGQSAYEAGLQQLQKCRYVMNCYDQQYTVQNYVKQDNDNVLKTELFQIIQN